MSDITAQDLEDEWGTGIALLMQEKSLEPGRNISTYVLPFENSALHTQASYVYLTTASVKHDSRVFKSLQGAALHMNAAGSMQSVFMERFTMGERARMSAESARNFPLFGYLILKILNLLDMEWRNIATPTWRLRTLAMCGGYFFIVF